MTSNTRRLLPLAIGIASLLAIPAAPAADFFWDGTSTTTDADGGTGIWDLATANWNELPMGGASVVWGNTTEDIANFGGVAGTVTVGAAGEPGGLLNVGTLKFTTSGYVIGNVARNGTLSFGSVLGSLDASALNTTTDQVTINSNLAGTGGLTIAASGGTAGSGFMRIAGVNTGLTGGVAITRGGVTATGAAAFGSNDITISNGATLLASQAYLSLDNNIAIGTGGANFRAYSTSAIRLGGVVSGANFNVVDTGVIRLTGVNTYTGTTSFTNAGTISFGDFAANLGTGSLTFNNNGTYRYTGDSATTGRNFAQPSSGTLDVLLGSTTVTHTGVTTGGASGRFITKSGLGTLVLSGTTDNSGGRFAINNGTLVLAKASTGSVHSIGANGNTDIGLNMTNGTVRLEGTGGDQIFINTAVVINGGTFDMNGRDEGFDSLSGVGGFVTNTSATPSTLTLGQNNNAGGVNNNYAGNIIDGAGQVSLVKAGSGTQILSGPNSYTGTTTISTGTLQLNSGGRLGTGAIVNNGTLAINSNSGTEIFNGISGTGGVTKTLSGVLTLGGVNTYAGATNVNGGALTLVGTLTSPITVASGAFLAGSGSTTSTIVLEDGSTVVGGASTVTGNGVTANLTAGGVNAVIAGGTIGTNTYDVIKYGTGPAPIVANFSTLGYRAGAAFADDAANSKITLTYTSEAKTWNPAVTSWDTGVSATWTGGDQVFQTGDAVTFGDIAADTAVSVGSIVAPSSFTVTNSTNILTLNGPGAIAGVSGLTKTGAGTVLLATSNLYGGQTLVNEGTLTVGHNSALGATGLGHETIVASGATLDLNGGLAADALVLAPEVIRISGTGVGSAGALVNSGAVQQLNALSYVTLDADASVGGTARFDLRNNATGAPVLDLAGNILTKTGTNMFAVVNGTITGGDINVQQGNFRVEAGVKTTGTGTVNLAGNTTFSFFSLNGGFNRPIVAGSNATAGAFISNATTTTSTLASNITLTAASNTDATRVVTFGGTGTTILTGNIDGTGAFSKNDAGAWVLAGTNTYQGYTLIRAGTVRVGSATAIPAGTRVTLYNGSTPTFDLNGFEVSIGSLQSGSAPDSGSIVNLGTANGKLTVTGNAAPAGPGSLAGAFYGRFIGFGDIEYNHSGTGPGNTRQWDWQNQGSEFIGNIIVTSGRLRFSSANGAGDSTALGNYDNDIIFNGTVVDTLNNQAGTASMQITNGSGGLQTNLAATRSVTINSGREGTFYVWGGTTFTVNGPIGGGGNLRLEDSGTLRLTNTANDYTGETKIVNGTLLVGNSGVIPDASVVRLGTSDGNVPRLNLNGQNETIGGLTSVQVSDSSIRTNGVVTSDAGPSTLTVDSAADHVFGGTITGTVAFSKAGAGTQTLSGANTYDGGTLVGAGTLLVTNLAGSGLGTGAVSVSAGATLGGTGTIAPTGANDIDAGGTLAPGAGGIGTLNIDLGGTTGGVSFAGGGFRFELGVAGGDINVSGLSDSLSLVGASAGDVAFSGNTIDFAGSGELGWYKLFATDGGIATWSGLTIDGSNLITAGLDAANLASGLTGQFYMGDGISGDAGGIYLQVVPEPASAALLAAGVMALGLRRRRAAR